MELETVPVGEAARILNIHPSTLRLRSDKGLIPSHRIGRRGDRRFAVEELLALVEKGGKGESPVSSEAESSLTQTKSPELDDARKKAREKVEQAFYHWLEATADWMHATMMSAA